MAISTLTLATRLNMQINGLLTALDIDLIGRETSKVIARIRILSNDARLDVRDWEMAQDRAAMEKNATEGMKRLAELRKLILKGSEHGIFSSIDVIDMSTQIDSIEADLQ
jgi:hypothetical protein